MSAALSGDCRCGHPHGLHASYGGCYVMVCRCRRDRVGDVRTGCPDHKRVSR